MERQPVSSVLASPQGFLRPFSFEMAQLLQLESYPSPKSPKGASIKLQQQNMG